MKIFNPYGLILASTVIYALPLQARGLKKLEAKTQISEQKSSDEEKRKEAVEKESEKKVVDEKTPPKVYEDIFFLGTNFSLVQLKANKGSWNASFTTDVQAAYRVRKLWQDQVALYASFRYLPSDVVVKSDYVEYRGIVESYLVGAYASYEKSNLVYNAGLEFGLSAPSLRSITPNKEKDTSLDNNGFNLVSSAGINWKLKPKLQVGAKLLVGVGRFTSVQTAASINLFL